MAYEYEHRIQGIIWSNEDYWCIDNDKESKELHEVYRKAQAWQKLKEEMKQDYIVTKQVNDEMALRDLALLDDYLRRIDQLDGTHEFSNLLDDMNREDK